MPSIGHVLHRATIVVTTCAWLTCLFLPGAHQHPRVPAQADDHKPDSTAQRPLTPRYVTDNARDMSGRDTAPFAHRLDASAAGLAPDAAEPFLRWSLGRVLKEGSTRESSARSVGDAGSMHAPDARPRTGRSEVRVPM